MKQELKTIPSADGKLTLHVLIGAPETAPKGVVQLAHGMTEHKGRYVPFMEFLAENGYASVIHDHRGHGESVNSKADWGYFSDETGTEIVKDLYEVTKLAKAEFPELPLYLFAHSMGTLVARNYLKTHDDEVEKCILCGAPFQNDGAKIGLALVERLEKRHGGHHRLRSVDKLVFGTYNRKFTDSKQPNRWICSVSEVVERYNRCPKCNFKFTLNGYKNLFLLMKSCFDKTGWQCAAPELPILFLAGGNDPVIGNGNQFLAEMNFLQQVGYSSVKGMVYPGKRHELLNEDNKQTVMEDILSFLEK